MNQPTESQSPPREPKGGRKNLSGGLIALALASSIVASACCVLPLVLVLVGITGAWMTTLTSLKPITPIFSGIALAALGWAGYLLFRPAKECAGEDGQACSTAGRLTKTMFFVCAVFIGAVLGFPLIAPYFY